MNKRIVYLVHGPSHSSTYSRFYHINLEIFECVFDMIEETHTHGSLQVIKRIAIDKGQIKVDEINKQKINGVNTKFIGNTVNEQTHHINMELRNCVILEDMKMALACKVLLISKFKEDTMKHLQSFIEKTNNKVKTYDDVLEKIYDQNPGFFI